MTFHTQTHNEHAACSTEDKTKLMILHFTCILPVHKSTSTVFFSTEGEIPITQNGFIITAFNASLDIETTFNEQALRYR